MTFLILMVHTEFVWKLLRDFMMNNKKRSFKTLHIHQFSHQLPIFCFIVELGKNGMFPWQSILFLYLPRKLRLKHFRFWSINLKKITQCSLEMIRESSGKELKSEIKIQQILWNLLVFPSMRLLKPLSISMIWLIMTSSDGHLIIYSS